jgi:hypothetical protein
LLESNVESRAQAALPCLVRVAHGVLTCQCC